MMSNLNRPTHDRITINHFPSSTQETNKQKPNREKKLNENEIEIRMKYIT